MVFNGHWAVLERNPGFVSRPSLGMGGWGGGGAYVPSLNFKYGNLSMEQ